MKQQQKNNEGKNEAAMQEKIEQLQKSQKDFEFKNGELDD